MFSLLLIIFSAFFSSQYSKVYDVSFSPDGKLLASCGIDHVILIWDTEDGREPARLHGHTDPVFLFPLISTLG